MQYSGRNAENQKKRASAPRLTPEEEKAAREVMKKMDKYTGKSEAELMREAARLAREGGADGRIDPKSLRAFERGISPYLDDEQKKKLSRIMSSIKKELQ